MKCWYLIDLLIYQAKIWDFVLLLCAKVPSVLAVGRRISSEPSVEAVHHMEMFLSQRLPLMVHYYLHVFLNQMACFFKSQFQSLIFFFFFLTKK